MGRSKEFLMENSSKKRRFERYCIWEKSEWWARGDLHQLYVFHKCHLFFRMIYRVAFVPCCFSSPFQKA